MNYDKIKRTGILFLLGIGAITSLSCNDNDNANYPERVPTRLSVMPLPERESFSSRVDFNSCDVEAGMFWLTVTFCGRETTDSL